VQTAQSKRSHKSVIDKSQLPTAVNYWEAIPRIRPFCHSSPEMPRPLANMSKTIIWNWACQSNVVAKMLQIYMEPCCSGRGWQSALSYKEINQNSRNIFTILIPNCKIRGFIKLWKQKW